MSDQHRSEEEHDQVDRIAAKFRRSRTAASVIVLVGAASAVFGLWESMFGETVGQSIMRLSDTSLVIGEEHDACVRNANGVFLEIQKCHINHGKL